MKNLLKVTSLLIAFAFFLFVEVNVDGKGSMFLKATQAQNDDLEDATIVNGPGQWYNCPGFFSGKGLDCMAQNSFNCKPRKCGE